MLVSRAAGLASGEVDPSYTPTGLSKVAQLSSGIGYIEITSITRYANFSFYFTGTAMILWFATLVASIFPQRSFLKNLSRTNWVSCGGGRGRTKGLTSEWLDADRVGPHLGCGYSWCSGLRRQ